MRLRITMLFGLGLLAVLGCEQRIPKDELGNVVFEVPSVPGANKPPTTPELDAARDVQGSRPGKHP